VRIFFSLHIECVSSLRIAPVFPLLFVEGEIASAAVFVPCFRYFFGFMFSPFFSLSCFPFLWFLDACFVWVLVFFGAWFHFRVLLGSHRRNLRFFEVHGLDAEVFSCVRDP